MTQLCLEFDDLKDSRSLVQGIWLLQQPAISTFRRYLLYIQPFLYSNSSLMITTAQTTDNNNIWYLSLLYQSLALIIIKVSVR